MRLITKVRLKIGDVAATRRRIAKAIALWYWRKVHSVGVWMVREGNSHMSREQMRQELNALLESGENRARMDELTVAMGFATQELHWPVRMS
jgi:hypothetical protein